MPLTLEIFKDIPQKCMPGTTWEWLILVKDRVKRKTASQSFSFSLFSRFSWNGLCDTTSWEYGELGLRSKDQSSLWHIHMSFIHSPYICCPEVMWPLILAGVCNHCSETTGVGGLCLLVGLIKTGYSSALYSGDYASEGSTCQRIMVLQKNNWYISWLIKFALRNIWTV